MIRISHRRRYEKRCEGRLQHHVNSVRFGSIGCAVCFDLNLKKLRLEYVKSRPDIIIFLFHVSRRVGTELLGLFVQILIS
jgi:hypothetical protein